MNIQGELNRLQNKYGKKFNVKPSNFRSLRCYPLNFKPHTCNLIFWSWYEGKIYVFVLVRIGQRFAELDCHTGFIKNRSKGSLIHQAKKIFTRIFEGVEPVVLIGIERIGSIGCGASGFFVPSFAVELNYKSFIAYLDSKKGTVCADLTMAITERDYRSYLLCPKALIKTPIISTPFAFKIN